MIIALLGYGKMGMEVEAVAKARGHSIGQTFTIDNNSGGSAISPATIGGADVCMDFSSPDAVVDNVRAAAGCGKNIVVGTTGWYDRLEEIRSIVTKHNIGLLYSPNFSLGVNIFFEIVREAARHMDRYTDYDAAIHEIHHRRKVDAPSGTALSLGEILLREIERKTDLLTTSPVEAVRTNQLHVSSTRLGNVPGTHTVMFDSEFDTIALTHTARNRRGFALGAVIAAEWIQGKRGVFTMQDVLQMSPPAAAR